MIPSMEYERDPLLFLTRKYDKINPFILGFEEHNEGRGRFSGKARALLAEETTAKLLAPQNSDDS